MSIDNRTDTELNPEDFGLDPNKIRLARFQLGRFVEEQAAKTAARVGFGWRASSLAPDVIDDLLAEYRCCSMSGLPLRVSPDFCDNVIYESPEVNHTYRFWHDCNHVANGLDFSPNDEMILAICQLDVLRAHGYPSQTLEHKLLHADSAGQTCCLVETGQWPTHPLRFAFWCLSEGVDNAIANEAAMKEVTK